MRRLDTLPRAVRAVLAATAATLCGCGDVCDDASEICGFEVAEAPAECSDVNECASICIVDWDGCDVGNAEAPEAICITKCDP